MTVLGRAIVYALRDPARGPADHVLHALAMLQPHATRLVVVHGGALSETDRQALNAVAHDVVHIPYRRFASSVYPAALERAGIRRSETDEVVFTGDSWFGPVRDLDPVIERMNGQSLDAWQMVAGSPAPRQGFDLQGYPSQPRPWFWTAIRRRALDSRAFREFWRTGLRGSEETAPELALLARLAEAGHDIGSAFASDSVSLDPALVDSEELIDDGCPLLDRAVFTSYPPFLDRRAVLGREVAATLRRHGYPIELLWRDLARTTAPRTLNTNGGMLEVLPNEPLREAGAPLRLAAVLHVSDLAGLDDLLRRLESLPDRPDLFVSATPRHAPEVEERVATWSAARGIRHELRVTPVRRGRDMGAFFVAFRDVLEPDRYDLVLKLHSRRSRRKSLNRRRYFRRYQLDNLLNSPGYVANLLDLFRAEPGLGLAFPPMMHIGHSVMGRGWLAHEKAAYRLRRSLGISVPMDRVSPLAPYGGMWIARPEALRLLTEHPWTYDDYAKPGRGGRNHLSRLQERMVAYAAGELGYHVRTVLTPEHAAISHTALDFKADQLFSTTRDWPVDQITLMHRAGYAGYGGTVALGRMYLRVNHPHAAAAVAPLFRIAYPPLRFAAAGRNALRDRRNRRLAPIEEEAWDDDQ